MTKLERPIVWINFVLLAALLLQTVPGCGRTLSRWGIGEETLTAPKGTREVMSVSFHKRGEATIKDVVFLMDDCTILAQEYKDISPFEGELTFKAHDGKPFRQHGCVPAPTSK